MMIKNAKLCWFYVVPELWNISDLQEQFSVVAGKLPYSEYLLTLSRREVILDEGNCLMLAKVKSRPLVVNRGKFN